MSETRQIPVAEIDERGRLRPIDPDWAEVIAASFREIGQQASIEVRAVEGGTYRYKLTAGGHRLVAARLCGWEAIRADVVERSDLEARLAEIDENLIRHELSALDRAVFLAERKRVWEELHPEARHGGDRKSRKNQGENQVANMATRFSTEIAEKCGLSERTIRRACLLAEGLDADTLGMLRRSPLADNQAALFAFLKIDPGQRRRAAKLLADGEASSLADVNVRLGLAAEADADEAIFRALVSGWDRANAKVRRRFRAHIDGKGKTAA